MYQVKLPQMPNQLGFLDILAGVTSAAAAGVQAYATIETLGMAESQMDLQEDLARQKAALEKELFESNQKIIAIQTSGLEARQDIELDTLQLQAKATENKLLMIQEIEEKRAELEKAQIQREIDQFNYESEVAKIEEQKSLQQVQEGSSGIAKPLVYAGLALIVGKMIWGR